MFFDANGFNGDIGPWDVSSVKNMENSKYSNNPTLVSFRTAVRHGVGNGKSPLFFVLFFSFFQVFEKTSFNRDIRNWDVSSVKDMTGSKFNQP